MFGPESQTKPKLLMASSLLLNGSVVPSVEIVVSDISVIFNFLQVGCESINRGMCVLMNFVSEPGLLKAQVFNHPCFLKAH